MLEGHEPGFKYAALIFSPPDAPNERYLMHWGKETFAGSITALIPNSDLERWRQWLGTVAWGKIERAGRVMVIRGAAAAPSVLDADDQRLRGEAYRAWRAFLLSEGSVNAGGHAWIISGETAGIDPGSSLLGVRTAQELDRIILPFYRTRPSFLDLKAAALEKHWSMHGRRDDSWFYQWVEIDELLSSTPLPHIVGYALLAHDSARARKLLEFSIPEFVRAAEGVIALPRNKGAKTFSDRALRLVPRLRTDEFVGADIEQLLLDLYQTRSDCVHGKLPFIDLQALGEKGEDRAAQLNYAADVLARGSLVLALRHSDKSIFETREKLERAWATSTFP